MAHNVNSISCSFYAPAPFFLVVLTLTTLLLVYLTSACLAWLSALLLHALLSFAHYVRCVATPHTPLVIMVHGNLKPSELSAQLCTIENNLVVSQVSAPVKLA